jgi:preprotein translocase subunit SecY
MVSAAEQLAANLNFSALAKAEELKKRIWFTVGALLVYRFGTYVPLPGIDPAAWNEIFRTQAGGILGMFNMFAGGGINRMAIFALNIMPYISASIIIQLMTTVSPTLEQLKKEGEQGRKVINQYTRYLTLLLAAFQAYGIAMGLEGASNVVSEPGLFFRLSTAITLTGGTMFMMWLGEQVTARGIGNGISLIIMAGIIARIPDATGALLFDSMTGKIKESVFTLGGSTGDISFEKILVLIFLFLTVVVGVIAMTKAQRRIPTQSAKHVRGRRVYGGTRQFLPMKVNAAGVMPVIFASTLLILPYFFFSLIDSVSSGEVSWARSAAHLFQNHRSWVYNIMYVAMIYVFTYFWVAITFNPKEIADNLKDHGSFIPGYRPGKRTADYLERVLMRITYVGAAFLAVIAIIPNIISSELEIPQQVASFYGGTGLLIVISVALDLVQKINSHLVMRNYPGLTDE